ncbi:MAG: VWA domain-containing protein [Pirellulales bacterium]|nr:VWA domain-containing protein [Pirellulales bacterium]
MQWSNPLTWWQWSVLATVPPAIVLLYFLRLRRAPQEVPSTYLWLKSIEDLHVNSLWQRLRRSLLLFLQLLLVGLLALALLGPSWRASTLHGGRYVFLIDTSASMAATDVSPTRLDEAKRRVAALIDEMDSGDVAMIVSFADQARVEQPFTDNHYELERRLKAIEQTSHRTSIVEALNVAAGLAGATRTGIDADPGNGERPAAQPRAQMFIFSDGKFADAPKATLAGVEPILQTVTGDEPRNVAITQFDARRQENARDAWQVFARLENFSVAPLPVQLELYVDDELADAQQVNVAVDKPTGVAFDLPDTETARLELRAKTGDHLAVDDRAWAVIDPPRRAKVVVVSKTPNEPLEFALSTESGQQLAETTYQSAAWLETPDYRSTAAAGQFDLCIFDRCQPPEMPQANTLFLGALPPETTGWKVEAVADVPQIIDTDRAHPLMQLLELGDVLVREATPLVPPPGGTVLMHSSAGPLLAIAPRQSYEDAVLAFPIFDDAQVPTNWPLRLSFPLFVLNALEYLGGRGLDVASRETIRPGDAVVLEQVRTAREIDVKNPLSKQVRVDRADAARPKYDATDQLGVYEVLADGKLAERFSVNLFDSAESDIRPRAQAAVKLGQAEIQEGQATGVSRRYAWKYLLLVTLVVLLGEWYTYHRRVSW